MQHTALTFFQKPPACIPPGVDIWACNTKVDQNGVHKQSSVESLDFFNYFRVCILLFLFMAFWLSGCRGLSYSIYLVTQVSIGADISFRVGE